ncbi:hypothetical protein D9615_001488 [Tricholomella constricta]|uniref:ditrans,polycis-polyprenyl diphosphate synthase [(2E,6E)-farnesyldiphosphate specific] n=1 Tax=Tricholomella constricta TaxID=117010 RepID=A0A8H5M8R4_9AGAR|nr:hypothetical protein D9615_001488 [Tricholomella constricta]
MVRVTTLRIDAKQTRLPGTLLKSSQNIRDSLGDDPDESSSESEVEYPLTPPPSDYSESRPMSPQHGSQLDMHTVTIRVSNKQTNPRPRKDAFNWRKDHGINHSLEKQMTLCLASRESSKPAIASLAQSFASRNKRKSRKSTKYPKGDAFTLTVDALDSLLESADHTLSSPDFMIIHPINPIHYNETPLELHGYPPWHIRLTEIYHNRFQHLPTWSIRHPLSSQPIPLDETTFNQALDEFATAEMRFGK